MAAQHNHEEQSQCHRRKVGLTVLRHDAEIDEGSMIWIRGYCVDRCCATA